MARSRQTELAVLGVLSVEPMSGYAIRDAIRDVLGHFWSESFGQIYPTLADLEARGLVRREEGSRARSSTFAITDSGQAQLKDLLQQPVQESPPRNGLMLRMFFGRTLGVSACRELLLEAQAEAHQRLATYRALNTELTANQEYAADLPYWQLTISAGEHAARATIAWAKQSLTALDELDTQNGDGTTP